MSMHGSEVCLLEVDDYNLYEEEATDHAFIGSEHHSKSGGRTMEAEKRIRREIANSNERRRMQSINAGFQALRTLLPRHEGEKLSKAAILQQTAEYIYSLEQEKTRLLSQNCQLKRLLNQHEGGEVPLKKRKNEILNQVSTIIPDSTEESSRSPEPATPVSMLVVKKESNDDIRTAYERERRLRRALEQQLRGGQPAARYPAPPPVTPAPPARPDSPAFEAPSSLLLEEPVLAPAAAPPPPPSAPQPAPSAPAPPPPPTTPAERPLLEAVIKAEPRVEVEVLSETPSRLYLASTSRQNLETIVEAIRHLEGDHLFGEAGADVPLALTKKPERPPPLQPHLVHQRPGVIVVKHT